jgi:hypothetical protein
MPKLKRKRAVKSFPHADEVKAAIRGIRMTYFVQNTEDRPGKWGGLSWSMWAAEHLSE